MRGSREEALKMNEMIALANLEMPELWAPNKRIISAENVLVSTALEESHTWQYAFPHLRLLLSVPVVVTIRS